MQSRHDQVSCMQGEHHEAPVVVPLIDYLQSNQGLKMSFKLALCLLLREAFKKIEASSNYSLTYQMEIKQISLILASGKEMKFKFDHENCTCDANTLISLYVSIIMGKDWSIDNQGWPDKAMLFPEREPDVYLPAYDKLYDALKEMWDKIGFYDYDHEKKLRDIKNWFDCDVLDPANLKEGDDKKLGSVINNYFKKHDRVMMAPDSIHYISPIRPTRTLSAMGVYRSRKRPGEFRYALLNTKLGYGTYGNVYLVTETMKVKEGIVSIKQKAPEKQWAYKLFNFEKNRHATMRSFQREKNALEWVEHLKFKPAFECYQGAVICMRYIPGRPLHDLIVEHQDEKHVLSWIDRLKIARELIVAWMIQVKSINGVHRDIKPGNILVDRTNGIKVNIIDFGFAKTADAKDDPERMGTPLYLSPEYKTHTTYLSDLYAIARICWELFGLSYQYGKQRFNNNADDYHKWAFYIDKLDFLFWDVPKAERNEAMENRLEQILLKINSYKPSDRPEPEVLLAYLDVMIELIGMRSQMTSQSVERCSIELIQGEEDEGRPALRRSSG